MILALTLSIVLGTMAGALLYSRRQAKARTMADWAVGGRRFGVLVFWFLNAGEIYTTFAVLGISGFAWAHGAPAYLAFTSVSLSATLGYWLMPRIWDAGRRRGLVTQADFFADHYRATWLGVVVGIAGIAALVVYAQELVPGRVGLVSGLMFGLMFGISGIGAAGLGQLADIYGIVWVYKFCAYLPLLGLATILLPDAKRPV